MSIAPQRPSKTVSGVRNVAVSFSSVLDSNELLNGVPVITEVNTTDLIISNTLVSTQTLQINSLSVPAGEAIQFNVAGGNLTNSPYKITISVLTNAIPTQTLIGTVVLTVISDA